MRKNIKYSILSFFIVCLILGSNRVNGQQKDISKILWTANWSHDNKYFAVGGVDQKIRIFSGQTFELLIVIDNNTEIQRMSWHPYLNSLAVAATDDGSKIINFKNDSIISSIKIANIHGTRAMAWNYTGDFLANADYEGVITIYNQHGELVRKIKKENTISNVAIDWHPAKNEFVSLSDDVRVYDLQGNLLHKFKHRKENVLMLCVKWHKSGNFFVIGDYGVKEEDFKPLLQYWHPDGTLIKEINNSKSEYRNVAWTKQGDKLATASDALRIWTKNGELIAEGFSADNLWGVDWSPDGKFIVTSSFDGYIKIWDSKAKLVKDIKY